MAEDATAARANGEEGRSVKSAERVLDILEEAIAAERGFTFMDLTRKRKIPKSSLHALLDALVRRQYLELHAETRRYTLGIRTLEAGHAYLRNHGVIEISRQEMETLVADVNETAQLSRLAGCENVYLARVDSSHALRLASETGRRLHAHSTGLGKALLAQLPVDEVRARFGAGPLPVYTPTTLPTVEALLAELERTRIRGFAIDNQEYSPGVFCLAVPIFGAGDRAELSLSVSVPLMRASHESLARTLARLARTSLAISRRTTGSADHPRLIALADEVTADAEIEALVNSPHYDLSFALSSS